jgi:hypothetical protein
MKKLLIIMLFGLLGCGPESNEEIKYDYSIINNSGVTVEIIPYKNSVKQIHNKVTLQNGAIFNKKKLIMLLIRDFQCVVFLQLMDVV